jgi:hypothetical protein
MGQVHSFIVLVCEYDEVLRMNKLHKVIYVGIYGKA